MSIERQEVLQKACDFLARREHSRKELAHKLKRACDDESLIEELLDKLADEGLQSDERFAESFIHHRYNKGQGPMKIQQELQQRGVSSELFEGFLYSEKYDWYEMAEQTRLKKYGEAIPKDYQTKAKQSRFLYSRGFNGEIINELFK